MRWYVIPLLGTVVGLAAYLSTLRRTGELKEAKKDFYLVFTCLSLALVVTAIRHSAAGEKAQGAPKLALEQSSRGAATSELRQRRKADGSSAKSPKAPAATPSKKGQRGSTPNAKAAKRKDE